MIIGPGIATGDIGVMDGAEAAVRRPSDSTFGLILCAVDRRGSLQGVHSVTRGL